MSEHNFPSYYTFMYPTLRAVQSLGGSGSVREIRERVVELLDYSEEELEVSYPNRDQSVLLDRLDWARSYCKLGGVLDSPKRGLYLSTPEGTEILKLTEAEARARLEELNAQIRRERSERRRTAPKPLEEPEPADVEEAGDLEDDAWKTQLVERLHRLSPDGFEKFVLALLRSYGLKLEGTGGTGDEGIDGIGIAPLSPVLSARVAVQAKRYDPVRAAGREQVALFQRDAAAVGAERAVMVSLSRFTEAARRAATTMTPTVDLIDGDRICELALDQELGIKVQPVVNVDWFDRFDQ